MYSNSDWVISLWGCSFIWHTCYTLTAGLLHLSNVRSECDCACECVCVCACVKVSLCTELCSIHVRNIRNVMRKRTIPWALEECRWCSMERREGGGVEYVPLFTPLVVFIVEDRGKGWSLEALSQGYISGFCSADISWDSLTTWESPGVKAEPINLHYLYLPHSPVPPASIPPSPSLSQSSSPGSLNKGMLSLSALRSIEETYNSGGSKESFLCNCVFIW